MADRAQDLTRTLQELNDRMALMQAELDTLTGKAKTTSQPDSTKSVNSMPRRKTLKRLGLAMLGGVGIATTLDLLPAQARIIVNPNGVVGEIVLPPGSSAPTNSPPAGNTYGIVASGDTTQLPLNFLPNDNTALVGYSHQGIGVYGLTDDDDGHGFGVYGLATNYGTGVYGGSHTSWGVWGGSDTDTGVHGTGPTGVSGTPTTDNGTGVFGESTNGTGVKGTSAKSYGMYGEGGSGTGVYGSGGTAGVRGVGSGSFGVYGSSTGSAGVKGESDSNYGVYGTSTDSYGVYGTSTNSCGVYGRSTNNLAGYFSGGVTITGTLTTLNLNATGSKHFKIDHPLDPAGKYLYHTSVESPDMMNIYNGLVTLDGEGAATVEMPDWFEALNSYFRYQLTSIGLASPNLHIASEIQDGSFKIAGGQSGQRVSWQVTGIRQDAYAKAHRSPVEEDKTGDEKGKFIHPELFGQPEELGIQPFPDQK